MARVIRLDDIRDAIDAFQSGETDILELKTLLRDAVASGAISQADADRSLRSAQVADAYDSVSMGDLKLEDLHAAGPRIVPDARNRSIQETRVRISSLDARVSTAPFTEQKASADHPAGTDALWVDPDPRAVAAPDQSMVGQVLGGRYLLERELGGGGMGVVYLASDQEVAGELFAIKVLRPEIRAYPEALPLLREEVRTTRALRHPNIVGVYSLNSDKQNIFMLMEYLEGKTLDALLDQDFGRGMPFGRAWPLIVDMCDALAYAHDHNVIHSDLKPSNVFVTTAGKAKLLDFGIARVARTRNGRFDPGTLGALTLAYASSEMLKGQKPDQRDDVYALACVIYEMLSGQHPYELKSALEAQTAGLRVAPLTSLAPAQNAILAQALSVGRADRTTSVEALLAGLEASGSGSPAAAVTSARTQLRDRRNTTPQHGIASVEVPLRSRQPNWSRAILVGLVALICVGIVGGIAALVYRARETTEIVATKPNSPVSVDLTPSAVPVEPLGAKPSEMPAPGPASVAESTVPPPANPADVDTASVSEPTPPAASTPVDVSSQPVIAANKPVAPVSLPVTRPEREPAQSGQTLPVAPDAPAAGKHPVAVVPLAESIDACPYPTAALKSGQTGSVGLLVYISPDGEPIETHLAESSGSDSLDQGAVQCVQSHGHFADKRLASKVPGYWGHMRFNWSFGE